MPKSVVITSYRSVGCSFIDWSIHFLNGNDLYYSLEKQSWVPLVSNPLTKNNAHSHRRNHPSGFNETKQYIQNFVNLSNSDLISLYPCPQHLDLTLKDSGFTIDDLQKPDCFAQIKQLQQQDYIKTLEYLSVHTNSMILVGYDSDLWSSLYYINGRADYRFQFSKDTPKSQVDMFNEGQKIFYANSINSWSNLALTNIWDTRERVALDLRLEMHLVFEKINHFKFKHLWLNAKEFWFNGEQKIIQIFEYLDLQINKERFEQWLLVFKNWQTIQIKNLEFSLVCKHIVDSIVNNSYYQIPKLNFEQETIIQHLLIYRYNLNLKTWQLSEFPKNTQDLYKLLEPNIHPIDYAYRELLTQFY